MAGFRIRVEWGEITVDGVGEFKDAKVFPDSVQEWDWNDTGTRHSPGIQPADVEELVDAGAEAIVLSRGMERRLSVMPETLDYLKSRGIEVHVAETKEAVDVYHRLSASKPTGALIHSTC
ncbi:MAG TPA: MTH938/NDUFAF3 family protein [Candidatus Limnocylindrales bacterium]|nr:MTH938/NDUFAF3 family protein [Candidatus Limnocylindrales bacterium]